MSKKPLTAAGGTGAVGSRGFRRMILGGPTARQSPFRKGGVKPHPTFSTVGDRGLLPAWLAPAQSSIASSSSMKPAIMLRPLSQKVGSLASSPKGASSSLWCLEPPAESMSKYFSWKPGVPSA